MGVTVSFYLICIQREISWNALNENVSICMAIPRYNLSSCPSNKDTYASQAACRRHWQVYEILPILLQNRHDFFQRWNNGKIQKYFSLMKQIYSDYIIVIQDQDCDFNCNKQLNTGTSRAKSSIWKHCNVVKMTFNFKKRQTKAFHQFYTWAEKLK